jgi:hypothetical protein
VLCPPASGDELSGAVSGRASLEGGGEIESERECSFSLGLSLIFLGWTKRKEEKGRRNKKQKKGFQKF